MTTILHISDTHLGKRQYKSDVRRQDFADSFDEAVDIALGEHDSHDVGPVDAVIHTGDLFDDNDTSIDDVYECQRIIQRLNSAGIHFYLIVGNHERKLRTQFADLYEEMENVTRLTRESQTVGNNVALYGIDAVKQRSWKKADFSLTPPDNTDAFRIVCMHQLFQPPISSEMLADYDMAETIERFEIDVDGVALGDYHKRCDAIVDGVEVWYPGSTERCALSESEFRSVDLLTIEGEDDPTLERQRLRLNTRPFKIIPIEFGTDDGFNLVRKEITSKDLNGAVAVVRLQGEEAPVTRPQIYSLLENEGAAASQVLDDRDFSAAMDLDIDVSESSNLQDIEGALNDALSDVDVSETASDIEDIVRSETVDSNVEGEVEATLDTDKKNEEGDS